jgi:hypothetical protein
MCAAYIRYLIFIKRMYIMTYIFIQKLQFSFQTKKTPFPQDGAKNLHSEEIEANRFKVFLFLFTYFFRRGKKRVTRMVVVVVLAFAVCWCPIHVSNLNFHFHFLYNLFFLSLLQ